MLIAWTAYRRSSDPSQGAGTHTCTHIQGWVWVCVDMAMSKQAIPLANWKTWWGPELAAEIGESLKSNLDLRKLPRGGILLPKSDFKADDLRDPLIGSIVEGLLKSYPTDRQPSGYLLGDSVLELDRLLGYCIFGFPDTNPIKDRRRRDDALTEGAKLKKLLSYVRTSACKSDVGRTHEVTYLKQLANNRVRRANCRNAALAPSSAGSSVSLSRSPLSPAVSDSSCLVFIGLLCKRYFS